MKIAIYQIRGGGWQSCITYGGNTDDVDSKWEKDPEGRDGPLDAQRAGNNYHHETRRFETVVRYWGETDN